MFTPQEANEEHSKISAKEEKKSSAKANELLGGKGLNDIQQFITESCTKAEDGLKKKKSQLSAF